MVKLNSFFQKLFLGESILKQIDSPINGEIKVVECLFDHREMVIGKVCQSGELVERVWKSAFSQIQNTKYQIQNTLILGLGCGDAAKLISKKWLEVKITGVEIDPVVIEIGKKYFGLGGIENLKIIIDDAIEYVENPKHQPLITNNQSLITKYDLILVDLYLGREFPKEAERGVFINGVKEVLAEGGIAIFNRLSYGDLENEAVKFSEKLRNFFPKVWTKRAITNLLIFCQK